MPTTATAVRFEGVTKRFGAVTAVDGAGFELRKGETVALLGPNGAGKSTTVSLLLGLTRPDAGTIEVLGGDPRQAVAAGRAGAMLQQGALLDGVTVAELVGFVGGLYPRPLATGAALERAGIGDLAKRRVEKLSGGQAQRVRFAMALAGDPELLFLDEPTVGMDVESRRAFWVGVSALAADGRTILFATHYLEEADEVADRIVVLARGRVVADATGAEIKARAGLRRIRFTAAPTLDDTLAALPGVRALHRRNGGVELEAADSDAVLRALFARDLPVRDIEVHATPLEDAFLALTGDAPAAATTGGTGTPATASATASAAASATAPSPKG